MVSMRILSCVAVVGMACLFRGSPVSAANVVLTPQPGFGMGFNGNNGDFSPGPVPSNLATAPGASAIGSSELGLIHFISNINDAQYGNSSSWIGDDGDASPWVGVALGGLYNVDRIAWGRDNTAVFSDRSLGVYTIEYTVDPAPSALSTWVTLGTVEYISAAPGVFDPALRHEFKVLSAGNPIAATGVRLGVSATGFGAGLAIDEIEVYGEPVAAVPLPSVASALAVILAGSVLCRRRSARW